MENYSYTSYPKSDDSSPRSREIDFENPPPWEENSNSNNYKVKLMCSYGGKISPRPHDNQLSYVGGDTKILAVERGIRFSGLVAKLSSLCEADICFKYQLPGEDLDALISVTNDEDLEHMMHEYDRLNRASPKPARLRLFLFPVVGSSPRLTPAQSFGSNASEGRSERERFVEALISDPVQSPPAAAAAAVPNNVDFLFGLEKGLPPPVVAKHEPITNPAVHQPKVIVPEMIDDRMIASDPIQKHIQDLQRLRIAEEQQAIYRRKSEENLAGGYTGDYYGQQKVTEKVSPATLPGNVQGQVPVSAGYWPEKQLHGGVYPPSSAMVADQPVYIMPAPSNMYHAPMARPSVTGPVGQGYYAVQQRKPTEVYREQQPVYNVLPQQQLQSATAQPTVLPPQLPPKMAAYSEGIRMIQPPNNGGVGITETGYAQVAYDGVTGRQVYYTAQGAVVAPPQPTAAHYQATKAAANTYNPDVRTAGNFNQDGGHVVPAKVTQAAV